jgi:3-deoxy-D-manno-octulosonate 8-phosphate phosphatase (KDO 8-P phosphatase)
MLRHKMKAGITGWAQINGWSGNTSIEKRIEYDLEYLVLLREAGLLVAIVPRKQTTIVTRRARDLGITAVNQNVTDNAAAITRLLARPRLVPPEVCYVGDDIGDLSAMRLVGVSVAVADAVEVRRQATYVTRASTGHGAIREVCNLILAAHHRRHD